MITSNLETFRHEIREWLENHAPKALMGHHNRDDLYWGGRHPELPHPDSQHWCEMCAERGLTTPTWPKAYGGGGLSHAEGRIWHEELQRLALPVPLTGFGLSMIGPTLLQFGTEGQKRKHLTQIIRGKIRWCQGYSEPNAGSDLASLQTAAVLEGDEYIINGQKIWTSYGNQALKQAWLAPRSPLKDDQRPPGWTNNRVIPHAHYFIGVRLSGWRISTSLQIPDKLSYASFFCPETSILQQSSIPASLGASVKADRIVGNRRRASRQP